MEPVYSYPCRVPGCLSYFNHQRNERQHFKRLHLRFDPWTVLVLSIHQTMMLLIALCEKVVENRNVTIPPAVFEKHNGWVVAQVTLGTDKQQSKRFNALFKQATGVDVTDQGWASKPMAALKFSRRECTPSDRGYQPGCKYHWEILCCVVLKAMPTARLHIPPGMGGAQKQMHVHSNHDTITLAERRKAIKQIEALAFKGYHPDIDTERSWFTELDEAPARGPYRRRLAPGHVTAPGTSVALGVPIEP